MRSRTSRKSTKRRVRGRGGRRLNKTKIIKRVMRGGNIIGNNLPVFSKTNALVNYLV